MIREETKPPIMPQMNSSCIDSAGYDGLDLINRFRPDPSYTVIGRHFNLYLKGGH